MPSGAGGVVFPAGRAVSWARRAQVSLVLAAADVRGEAVVVRHPDARLRLGARRERDATEARVNRDLIALRAVGPAAQVCGDDVVERDGAVFAVAPDEETLLRPVVGGCALVGAAAADRGG